MPNVLQFFSDKLPNRKSTDEQDTSTTSFRNNDNNNNNNMKNPRLSFSESSSDTMDAESVYDFYRKQLLPAILHSFPILLGRVASDSASYASEQLVHLKDFLLPAWIQEQQQHNNVPDWKLVEVWQESLQSNSAIQILQEFLREHLDVNGDGEISAQELWNVSQVLERLPKRTPTDFWTFVQREWPLMDWKVGVFLWRTFGGILFMLALLSIVPGPLHRLTGRLLRWPILLLTYFLIIVELMVYIVIRLVIRVAEIIVATPKHRRLRNQMAQAQNFEEWYQYAAALDVSQKRDQWQKTVQDSTSYRYNWALIQQLMEDMRTARDAQDSLQALAVLQQCTRKNVGGIMSEDIFSFTNTGEPKYIVKDFMEEVAKTLHWVTDEALALEDVHHQQQQSADKSKAIREAEAKLHYNKRLERKVRGEKDKIWKSLLSWATLTFGDEAHGMKKDSVKPVSATAAANNTTAVRERTFSGNSLNSEGTPASGEVGIPKRLPSFHREQLIAFLKRARAAYGRTALCLSGGAMMGLYHFGHLQGLMETDCLPHVISGTSAGSVLGAIVCTRTNEELRRDMRPEEVGPRMKCFARSWPDRIRSLWKNGCMFSADDWLDMIKWFTCGDMTFEEAYRKTGRTFCITLASTTKKAPPVLLNYITAPNVTIPSAVVASAAVPGFVNPVRLQIKDADGTVRYAGDETYFDGSIEHDIPINGLAEQLNCQFFVAAQCNPHVVPFFFNAKGGVGRPSRWSSGEQEASWRGGFLFAALELYLKNDMKAKFVFLNDLEAAVGFTSTMMVQDFVGSTTIVPQVKLWDFFTLFKDAGTEGLDSKFRSGAVAAYHHAAMIRLHYRIADTIDQCLEKLGNDGPSGRRSSKVRPSRRASFEVNDTIYEAIAKLDPRCSKDMPAIITAALKERIEDEQSTTSMSENSM